ncbi:MAG TPA: DUF488 family protein [Puia sp.]|nr:DUF488 family protein [Puia sp.]
MQHPTIDIKRVYAAREKADGIRILVDRLWPRGIKKEEAHIEEWAKDIAPSAELREWYGHDPDRWPEFQKKYKAELKHNESLDAFIEKYQHEKHLTLIYATKDEQHTHALVLKDYLDHEFSHR